MPPLIRARLHQAFSLPNRWRASLPLLLLYAGLSLLTGAWAAEAPPDPAPPDSLPELQSRLQDLLVELQIPALGVVVARQGQVEWVAGMGTADLQTGRPADAHTLFRIGSISKSLLALAILREVEAGRLDLQTPVRELAPDMPIDNPWSATDPVRLVHLLEHTAGFDDMHFQRMERDPNATSTQAQMQLFAPEFRVRWRPGERQSYSNPGYGLVAYILERRTGRTAEDYISAEVLTRLGMHDTRWTSSEVDDRIALGYETGSQTAVPEAELSMPAVGALWSTASDMSRYLQFYLDGRGIDGLVGPESLRRMETPETSLASRAGFPGGYALANYASDLDGWRLRGHNGGLPGYLAYLQYERDAGVGFVLLFNTIPERSRPIRQLLLSYATQGLQPPAKAPVTTPDPARTGWYQQVTHRNQILAGVESLANVAKLEIDGEHYRLVHPLAGSADDEFIEPLANQQLRDNGLNHSNGVFTVDGEGTDALVTDDVVFLRSSWWRTALPLYLVCGAVFLLLLCLLATPFWAWQWFRRHRTKTTVSRTGLRFWPVLSAVLLALLLLASTQLSLTHLTKAQIDAPTLFIWLGGWAFGLSAVIGCWQLLRHRQQVGGLFVQMLSTSASLAALGLTAWLWQVKLLGVRLWAW
ncbi:MAG: beta-lactamase family protein [Xanthomonadales bacterium]|nr:beta-lactamase family protein [Xanthomonadales bacterium]